jgi:hypothetical protein
MSKNGFRVENYSTHPVVLIPNDLHVAKVVLVEKGAQGGANLSHLVRVHLRRRVCRVVVLRLVLQQIQNVSERHAI